MDATLPQPTPQPVAFRKPPSPKASHRVLKAAAAALVGLGVLGVAAWFAVPLVRDRLQERPADVLTDGIAASRPDPAKERDQERYRHVNEIRIAINSYVNDFKAYPESLEALVPKYLLSVPKDPSTGTPYSYAEDAAGYMLTFALETGIFSLSPGEHFLTAKGIDIRTETPFVARSENPTVITITPTEPGSPIPDAPDEDAPPGDADGDGLSDDMEAFFGTDPTNHDTDMDGLSDREETGRYGTDPKDADTDNDGYADGAEVDGGYDPTGPGKLP